MIRSIGRYLLFLSLFPMMSFCMDGLILAAETGKIISVNISSDLHKVVIKTQGEVAPHSTFLLDKPPRLVIDFPEVRLDLSQGMKAEQKEDGLTVRVARTQSGVRVVLDFGRGRVPEYKIHRMGNDVIVFLEDSMPAATAPDSGIQPEKPLPQRTQPPTYDRPAAAAPTGISQLEVKGTQIIGGLVVLKVAEAREPANIYRVELGLDLDRLGFTSARIIPPSGQKTSAGPPQRIRVVPREMNQESAPRSNSVDYSNSPNSRVEQERNPVAPENSFRTGQVSQPGGAVPQERAKEPKQSLLVPTHARMPPLQPVTETLRARVYGQENSQRTPTKWVLQTAEGQESTKSHARPQSSNSSRQSGSASVQNFVDQVIGYRPQQAQAVR